MCVASVRFPDGWREFRYVNRQLEFGDVLTHTEECYRVVSVARGSHGYHDVTVELETTYELDEDRHGRGSS